MADGERDATSKSGNSRPIVRIASLFFFILCVAFVVLLLVRDWSEIVSALRHARYAWLFPAGLCAVGAMLLMAWRWGSAIVVVGGERSAAQRVISAFFVGEAGKYIPGAIWAMLGRSELARREGYETPIAYSSVALSLVGCYLAASLTALILAVLALTSGSINMPWWPVALVVVVGIAAIHPRISRSIMGLVSRVLRRQMTIEIPSWTSCLRLTMTYVPVWVLIAASTTFVTASLVVHPPIARVALAAVVSWIIGFITPSPGGIGVREAVFVALAGIAAGPAAAAAVLARVLFVLIDISGAGVGWFVLRWTDPTGALEITGNRAN
jgi:glycosyltransferase 2 family protein